MALVIYPLGWLAFMGVSWLMAKALQLLTGAPLHQGDLWDDPKLRSHQDCV